MKAHRVAIYPRSKILNKARKEEFQIWYINEHRTSLDCFENKPATGEKMAATS